MKKEVNIFFNFTLEIKNYVIWNNKCYPQIKYNVTAIYNSTAVKLDYETAQLQENYTICINKN